MSTTFLHGFGLLGFANGWRNATGIACVYFGVCVAAHRTNGGATDGKEMRLEQGAGWHIIPKATCVFRIARLSNEPSGAMTLAFAVLWC